MERRTRRAWLLVALAVAFVAVLGLAPKTALAADDVVEVDSEEALRNAVTNAPTDGSESTIQLSTDIKLIDTGKRSLSVNQGQNIRLNLNGNKLTFAIASSSIQVTKGTLTVTDATGGGQIIGEGCSASGVLQASNSGILVLESGAVSSDKTYAIGVGALGLNASFTMNGGSVTAKCPVRVQRGTATILGGTLTSDNGGSAIKMDGADPSTTSPSLTVGSEGKDGPTLVGSLEITKLVSPSSTLNIFSGTVPSITGNGTIPNNTRIDIGFENSDSITAKLPSVLEGIEQNGLYYIKPRLTEENADASVTNRDGSSTALYAFDRADTIVLNDGDTLTLLKNVNSQVDVKANGDVTIDLGGCSVTSSTDYALSVRQTANNGSVTVKSSAPATLSGAKAGISIDGLDTAAATLDYQPSNITLAPAAAGIELGNARIPFNEANARLVPNGGFRTVHNGKPYIYGTLSAAVADADANTEITLLNDYDGAEPMFVSTQSTFVVDLGGHTYRTTAACAAQVATAHADVTFKNGTIVSAAPTEEAPNIVGAYLKGTGITDVSITLDNVDLTMEHSGNAGIIVQGLNTDNTVTLNGCTLTVPDDVMGIYFPPAKSSLVINDTIINAGTGIGIKGGSLTVSGSSEIHAHGAYEEAAPTENGISETGDAIYVDGGYAANDGRNVTVAIENGSFSSENGNSIQELVVSDPSSDSSVKIAVSGGSFDDTSVAGYLTDKAAVVANANGSCTVYPSVEEARANGGGYQVVDEAGNTWFFSTPEAAAEFAKDQGDSAKVEEVLWTVTFDDCLDSTENQTVSVHNGEPVARPAEDPVCAGYRFLGWYSDKALTQAWDFGTPVHGDLTLYAKWEQVGGSTSAEKPATPGSNTTTADDGLAKTGDPTLVAPLAASALAGASALGVALGLRRRDS